MNNFLNAALEYHAAGLPVVPFTKKASGGITFPDWKKYRGGQTEAQVRELFSRNSDGIAMLTGVAGVEAIDIDVKHDPDGTIGKKWFEWVNLQMSGCEAIKQCVIQKTKSNGWHVIYRTSTHEGNRKLAYLEGSKEAVIETRGVGGLLFVAPTPGYEVKRGDLKSIPQIQDKARECFFRCAAEFSTRDEADIEEVVEMPAAAKSSHTVTVSGVKPGEAFNQAHDVLEMAEKYGWRATSKSGAIIHLTRPGSKSGDIHASIVTTKAGERRFYPFTTSTAYDAQKCYSPFSMYAVEEHRGDLSAAAKALVQMGYGTQSEQVSVTPHPPGAAKTPAPAVDVASLFERASKTKFDYHAPIPNPDAVLTIKQNGKTKKVGGFGQIGVFTGHEKSGKSFLTACVAASVFGREILGFQLDLRGRKLKWVDTEQSIEFYALTQRRIHNLGGVNTNMPYYEAFHLRNFSPLERVEIIEWFVMNEPNLGVLVIDGFVDLLMDYNNLAEVQVLVSRMMKWSYERNVLILGILHLNKGDGKMRGHVGSELKNKVDFAINVVRDEHNYTVTNPYCRYGEFSSFEFQRDDNGDLLPQYFGGGFETMPKSINYLVSMPRTEETWETEYAGESDGEKKDCPF